MDYLGPGYFILALPPGPRRGQNKMITVFVVPQAAWREHLVHLVSHVNILQWLTEILFTA